MDFDYGALYSNILENILSNNSFELLNEFINRNGINFKNYEKKSLLHVACESFNDTEKIKYLLERKANLNEKDEKQENTPLFYLLKNKQNDLKTTKYLVDLKADLNLVNKNKDTALHMHLMNTHVSLEITKYLIERKGDPNKLNLNGHNLLHLSVLHESNLVDHVKYFVDKKVDLDASSFTSLSLAVQRRNVSLPILKLVCNPGNVNFSTNYSTPLGFVYQNSYSNKNYYKIFSDIISFLVYNKANPFLVPKVKKKKLRIIFIF